MFGGLYMKVVLSGVKPPNPDIRYYRRDRNFARLQKEMKDHHFIFCR